MKMNEILRIVRKVEIAYAEDRDDYKSLELFVSLIEAAEREKCAKYLEKYAAKFDDGRSAALEVAAEHIRASGQG
jgi:hypothetical protein